MCGSAPSYPAQAAAPAPTPTVTPITPVTPVVEGQQTGGPLAPTPTVRGGTTGGGEDTSKVTAKTLLGA